MRETPGVMGTPVVTGIPFIVKLDEFEISTPRLTALNKYKLKYNVIR